MANLYISVEPTTIIPFAEWKLISEDYESAWCRFGATYCEFEIGTYELVGKELAGWTLETEDVEIVIADINDLVLAKLKYIQHGNLKVKITDNGAKTDARWRIVGTEDWYYDGDEIDLYPDSYEIEFNEIENYVKPENITVAIISNYTRIATGNYEAYGELIVNISLPSASMFTDIPKWRIKDSEDTSWKISGYYLKLIPGNHTIEFNVVDNILTSGDVDIELSQSEGIIKDIIYVGMRLLAIPSRDGFFIYNNNNFNRLDLLDSSLTDINQVAFDNTGRMLAVASNTSPYLRIYDCIDYVELNEVITKPSSGCRAVCFSNGGEYLAVSYNQTPYLTVYDTSDWSELPNNSTPNTLNSHCKALAFDSNDQKLVVGFDDEPYMVAFTIPGMSTSSITPGASENTNDGVLCFKYNYTDLLVGAENGLYVYNNVMKKYQTLLSNSANSLPVYGIEIVGDQIIVVTSLMIYVYQFVRNSYALTSTSIPIIPNVNTWVKIDPENQYLIIGGLRNPNLQVYEISSWSPVDLADQIGSCRKFDISKNLSTRSFVRKPVNLTPLDNTKGIYNTCNLTSSNFSYFNFYGTAETHIQTQWRIFNSTNTIVSNQIIDVGNDLLSLLIPEELYDTGEKYTWQVRHKSSVSGWSFWSNKTSFQTIYAYIETPVNLTPESLDIDVIETPTLTASAFTSVNSTDVHIKSQWRILEINNFSMEKYNSGDCDDLITHTILSGVLNSNEPYKWQVRYKGDIVGWSEWSELTEFATGVWEVLAPINVSPIDNATGIDANNIILETSDFEVSCGSDTHIASNWLVYTSSTATIAKYIFRKELPDTALTSYQINPDILENGIKDYYWCGRYKGQNYGWSGFSARTKFTTKALEYSIINVKITPNIILPGNDHILRWKWKISTDDDSNYSSYQESNTDISILSDQTITIAFEDYSTYATPTPTTITLVPGQRYDLSVVYQPVSGSITVNLTPNTGTWKIQGQNSWRPSGYTEKNLPYNTYSIAYSNLVGYETPVTHSFLISESAKDHIFDRSYILSTDEYSLKVTCNHLSGYWKLSSEGVWYPSGTVISLYGITSDTIVFKDILNNITPAQISLDIPDDYATHKDPDVDTDVLKQILFNGVYQRTDGCTLKVNLNIGRWKLINGNKYLSSGHELDLSAGSYEIMFEEIDGYVAPFNSTVTISAGQDKILSFNYLEIGNNLIRINTTPSGFLIIGTFEQYIKFRSRYKATSSDAWGEYSEWIRLADENYKIQLISAPLPGIFEIEVKCTRDDYVPVQSIKTINYTEGVGQVTFDFKEVVVVQPDNFIDIIVDPERLKEIIEAGIICQYRFGDSPEWEDVTNIEY